MGSDAVTFEGSSFATTIASPSSKKPLNLVGNGIYDTEIHFLQIKFYAIGAYVEAGVAEHLQAWKGKTAEEALAADGFFSSFCDAPVEKLLKLVIIKEVKGSQVVTQLQSSVRDTLAYADKYEDEEEEALDKLVEYFQKKAWLSQGTSIYFHWPKPSLLQVSLYNPQDEESAVEKLAGGMEFTLDNENVARGILQWLAGENSFSPSLLNSLSMQLVAQLA